MVFTKESSVPNCMLQVHNEVIKQEEHLIYLGELTSNREERQGG